MKEIGFVGEISHDRIENLLNLVREDSTRNRVWIFSPGGTFDFFSRLGPPLQRQGIITVGVDVKSAAIVLFLLGFKRLAVPESEFFFHEVRAITNGGHAITICDVETAREFVEEKSQEEENISEFLRGMKTAQTWMLSYISSVSGIPRSLFLDLMRQEATLSAKEALYYGIAHQIIDPRLQYNY